jgi:6-pyruvoyltetrahydropterin/6-carboxytetrahydropterin synthase
VFSITVEREFSASHQLMLPGGTRERLHEHNWLVRVTVVSSTLDGMGLVMDFNKLLAMVDGAIAPFKRNKLEETPPFREINASAENVAAFLYGLIQPQLEGRLRLGSVQVMEAPGCWAEYRGD